MESPRFNDTLSLKYIVVQSSYNNRVLSSREYAGILHDSISELSELIDDSTGYEEDGFDTYDEDKEEEIEYKDGEINIIPVFKHARLLFTQHSGYTWIDADSAKNKIYPNGNDEDTIQTCLTILDKDYVEGSFVFELCKRYDIDFKDILHKFLRDLTQAEYCAHFDLENLEDAMYDAENGVLYLTFDTSSG